MASLILTVQELPQAAKDGEPVIHGSLQPQFGSLLRLTRELDVPFTARTSLSGSRFIRLTTAQGNTLDLKSTGGLSLKGIPTLQAVAAASKVGRMVRLEVSAAEIVEPVAEAMEAEALEF